MLPNPLFHCRLMILATAIRRDFHLALGSLYFAFHNLRQLHTFFSLDRGDGLVRVLLMFGSEQEVSFGISRFVADISFTAD